MHASRAAAGSTTYTCAAQLSITLHGSFNTSADALLGSLGAMQAAPYCVGARQVARTGASPCIRAPYVGSAAVRARPRGRVCRISAPERPAEQLKGIKLPKQLVPDDSISDHTSTSSGSETEDGECPVYVDRHGNFIEVMCCDYGFRSGHGRLYQSGYGQIPTSAWSLAWNNFNQEWTQLRRSFRYNEYNRITELNPPHGAFGEVGARLGSAIVRLFSAIDQQLEDRNLFSRLLPVPIPEEVFDKKTGGLSSSCREIRRKLQQLKLSNQAVWDREHAREAAGEGVDTPWFVKGVYLSLCLFLDAFYENRPIQRFWFLETVARMPYFSYITMLHLYESLGWWRAGAELRKVHFAEEWNELHHLQIMEALGGDQLWVDRFMAYHAAGVYYFILLVLFVFSPQLAYNFSELIEAHAVDTYGEFADANEELLKSMPPPQVAAQYYTGEDLYMFDEFQTSRSENRRSPACNNLYDVFINIRDDEGEHVKTMAACQDTSIVADLEERKAAGRRL